MLKGAKSQTNANTFNGSGYGFETLRNRRAHFVIGISSNVTTDLAENGAIITRTGSRADATFWLRFWRVGVTTTLMYIDYLWEQKRNKIVAYLECTHDGEIVL